MSRITPNIQEQEQNDIITKLNEIHEAKVAIAYIYCSNECTVPSQMCVNVSVTILHEHLYDEAISCGSCHLL